jgi:hypothetical protein
LNPCQLMRTKTDYLGLLASAVVVFGVMVAITLTWAFLPAML